MSQMSIKVSKTCKLSSPCYHICEIKLSDGTMISKELSGVIIAKNYFHWLTPEAQEHFNVYNHHTD